MSHIQLVAPQTCVPSLTKLYPKEIDNRKWMTTLAPSGWLEERKMRRILWGLVLSALLLSTASTSAQVNPYKTGTPGVTGYRSEVLAEVMVQEDKFVRLAEAIPAEKYNWRPSSDVRSVAEVFLHVSGANYSLYKMVGTAPPDGIDLKNLEKSTTDKARIVATLKDSFAHAKKAITDMPDANLEKPLDWFGGKNTQRGILLFVVRHTAEHLGQSIAYARMVGVVPPWTEDAQRRQQKPAPPKLETPKKQ